MTLADRLSAAFPGTDVVEPAPGELPADMAATEALMDRMMAPHGPFLAFKLGATIPAVQATLGLPGPFFGPLPAARLAADGATLAPPVARQRGVESEYGFRLARDLAPDEALTAADLHSLFDEVLATIEIPGTRYAALGQHGGFALAGDGGAAGALVLGPGRAVADFAALDAAPVVLEIDGQEAARGDARVIAGGAAGPLLGFLAAAQRRGYALRRGQVIVTGSCTGYVEVPPGARATARFEGLGLSVSCRFA